MNTKPLRERLLAKMKTADSGCWEWTASRFRHGYGQISVNRVMRGAHRVSYELHCGEIPDGLHVLHKCDNKLCINPRHLFLGTNTDNVTDMMAKGRHRPSHGARNGNAKLTEPDILTIRSAADVSGVLLAKHYGVSEQTISKIRARIIWAHI